jgi:GxxExxY protein
MESAVSEFGSSLECARGMTIMHGDPRTYQIIGAAMEVHSLLHRGYLESVYCDSLAIDFHLRGIPFADQVPCQLKYKGQPVTGHHKLDFICFDGVVVEVKAVSSVGPAEDAQVLNYLALTGHRVALLLNFGERSLFHKRFVLDR